MEAGHQYMRDIMDRPSVCDTLGKPYIGYSEQIVDEMGSILNNLAEFRTGRKGFMAFTLDFAAMAADTFFSILKQVIVAHNLSPPSDWC
jgi:hypothetical protein